MTKCNLCPRHCNVDRTLNRGFCNEQETLRIAKIIENFEWEEPCITGNKGSLAIFFSGCNLRCDYCQNHEISSGGIGQTYTIEEFCKLIEEKQDNHSSIDLVTPTHFSSALKKAFSQIKPKIPVVWNTNGYETVQNIKEVSSFVDIFLTDFKYADDEIGKQFSRCNDYFSIALPAITEMCQLKKDLIQEDFMKQGVLIRHLVLPDHLDNSISVLNIIKENFADRKISVMSQFTPNGKSKLNRKLKPIEYKLILTHMEKLGLTNGYFQDCNSANDVFVPKF
ncbi:MAG: radical SAM protein [Clostridia bacterium]|nr:radical SAM protein [Clostridia bacterium]